MRVLITGGAGFIGSAVVRALESTCDIVILDDLSAGFAENLDGTAADLIEGSITDRAAVASAASDCDAIVHLAAIGSVPESIRDPRGVFAVNVEGTMNVLDQAVATGCHVVFASSAAVFGANPESPKTAQSWTLPLSPYGSSKLAGESYALSYAECFDVDALVFRFFNVYGARQRPDHPYAAVIPLFLDRALRGEPLLVHGDGAQTRDFVSVDYVADIIARAVRGRVTSPTPVLMSTGVETSVRDLAADVIGLAGSASGVEFVEARAADIRESQGDPADLRRLFPDVAPVPLAEGLPPTVEWMRRYLAP